MPCWNFNSIPTGDMTLKAKWKVRNYNVCYPLPAWLSVAGSPITPTSFNINSSSWTVSRNAFNIHPASDFGSNPPVFLGWSLTRFGTPSSSVTVNPYSLITSGAASSTTYVYPHFDRYQFDANTFNSTTGAIYNDGSGGPITYNVYLNGVAKNTNARDSHFLVKNGDTITINNIKPDSGITLDRVLLYAMNEATNCPNTYAPYGIKYLEMTPYFPQSSYTFTCKDWSVGVGFCVH